MQSAQAILFNILAKGQLATDCPNTNGDNNKYDGNAFSGALKGSGQPECISGRVVGKKIPTTGKEIKYLTIHRSRQNIQPKTD